MYSNATFQDIVNRKNDFIGKKCLVDIGVGSVPISTNIIGNIEIWGNCIDLSFSEPIGRGIVLPVEEVSAIYLTDKAFQIRSHICDCTCKV